MERKDFAELMARKGAESRAQAIGHVLHAAVDMKALTGNEHWDAYLSMLQALIEQAQSEKQGFEISLSESTDLSHQNLLDKKFAIAMCSARVSALDAAMSLPRQIIESADKLQDK